MDLAPIKAMLPLILQVVRRKVQPLIVVFRGISAITGSLSTDPNEEYSLSLRGNILMERRIFICSFVFPFLTFAV